MKLKRILGLAWGYGLVTLGVHFWGGILPVHMSPQVPLQVERLDGGYDVVERKGVFHGQEAVSQKLAEKVNSQVLGVSEPQAVKRIEVDLTAQRLYAFENDKKVAEFMVSTGKWGRTPTGTFRIWTKLRYTKMEGGNKALHTYYYLPNVPYTMFFYNQEVPRERGFGIHGTYWHSNFGEPMSHGCVNMRTRDVEKLYRWAGPDDGDKRRVQASKENPGTEVVIYGVAP